VGLLLPDGRILVAGSGRGTDGTDQLSAELYSPPYLFKGSRPAVASAPANIQCGQTFFIGTPDAANISSVSLLRPGAATHAFNQDQRFMGLTFQQVSGGLNVQLPANKNLAPPGYYMIFLVNSNGVPSIGRFVKVQ
jgi:hypothetical protein